MRRFISGRSVFVPGLLLVVLGFALSMVAVEQSKWTTIAQNRLTTVWVGQEGVPVEFEFEVNKCCKKGAFTSCKSNVVFSCSALPLVCNPLEEYFGACTNHSCIAKTTYRCATTSGLRNVDLCETNGFDTPDDCPQGQKRCAYIHFDRGLVPGVGGQVDTTICVTGSNLCPDADQPTTPCNN